MLCGFASLTAADLFPTGDEPSRWCLMYRTPQEKFILLFEAAKRSLLAAEMLLQRLAAEVAGLSKDIDQSVDIQDRAVQPLLSAVAFIDFAHRFGSVVDSLPLISKKAPALRKLRTALRPVEAARNHLQHMRGDLSSNANIDYPILGSLSWAHESSSYTIFLSQPTKADTFSIAYDIQSQCWAARHQYTVKNATIDLDAVLAEMRNMYDWIVQAITFSDPSFAELKWGKTQSIGLRIMEIVKAQQGVPADPHAPIP